MVYIGYTGPNAPPTDPYDPAFIVQLSPDMLHAPLMQPIMPSPWVTYTPAAFYPFSGAFGGGATATGRYVIMGNTLFVSIGMTVPNVGSGGGAVHVSLPNPANADSMFGGIAPVTFIGRNGGSGELLQGVIVGGTTPYEVKIRKYDNSFPIVSGNTFWVNGLYDTP